MYLVWICFGDSTKPSISLDLQPPKQHSLQSIHISQIKAHPFLVFPNRVGEICHAVTSGWWSSWLWSAVFLEKWVNAVDDDVQGAFVFRLSASLSESHIPPFTLHVFPPAICGLPRFPPGVYYNVLHFRAWFQVRRRHTGYLYFCFSCSVPYMASSAPLHP